METNVQPKIMIENNKDAENKDIVLMIPQGSNSATIKNALIGLFEYVTIITNDKVRAQQAEEAKKEEDKKAEEITVELVKE